VARAAPRSASEGPGAIATTGSRVAAFVLDIAAAGLIGALVNPFLPDPTDVTRSIAGNVAFVLQVLLLTTLTGQSLGKRVLGIRVVRLVAPDGPPGFLPAAVRTLLLLFVLPAVITDRDGRGCTTRLPARRSCARARPAPSRADR
jgi:uncharacterized RDD family membrane protein YckC